MRDASLRIQDRRPAKAARAFSKRAWLVLLLTLAALLHMSAGVESRDNPARPCADAFKGEVERLREGIRARFGEQARMASLPRELVPELEWLDGEQPYLSRKAEEIGSRASSLESEEFFVRSDEGTLQANVTALIRDIGEFQRDDELFGKDASTHTAEVHRHNNARRTFMLPDEQAAADAYERERAELEERRARLISRQNELRARAQQLESRKASLEQVERRVVERRNRLSRLTDALREETERFLARCAQSTARVRALMETVAALPEPSSGSSVAQSATEAPPSLPADASPPAPADIQTAAPPSASSAPVRAVPEPASQEAWQKAAKVIVVDPVKDALVSAAGEAAMQVFKRSYDEHFKWYVERAHLKKYAKYARFAKYGAGVGYVWTGANILMDTSIRSMDQKTAEVERHILLIGDYARAMERLKKLGRLKKSDPGYAALREMMVRMNKEMPSTSGQYSISTPAGTLDLEFVAKSFSPMILVQETVASLAGQYAASKVTGIGQAWSKLTKSEKRFIGTAGKAFFKKHNLKIISNVTPNARVRAYQHFLQGSVEGGASVGAETGVKVIQQMSGQVGEQLRLSREAEPRQEK